MAKFCANLAFLFNEQPLLERYKLAKNAGFKAVESGFPFGFTVEQVTEAKKQANIEQILINIYTGDVSKGELGFAAIPGKESDFKASLEKTITYAKALGAKKMHIMSGKVENPTNEHDFTYENNIKYAVGVLEKEGILGVIEPINKYSVPNYYMNSYDKALKLVQKVNSPNLKIMLDLFHCQLIKGNITNTIRDLKSYIGHVQIAQVPDRNEPNTEGELNYRYILDVLKKEGEYNDWIGLEYKPKVDTLSGLNWVQQFNYSL